MLFGKLLFETSVKLDELVIFSGPESLKKYLCVKVWLIEKNRLYYLKLFINQLGIL